MLKIHIHLDDADEARLKDYQVSHGFRSPGLAAKDLLLKALESGGAIDALKPYLDHIEEEIIKASSRGTKASIAALAIASAAHDDALRSELDLLDSEGVFNWAWEAAGVILRPDWFS